MGLFDFLLLIFVFWVWMGFVLDLDWLVHLVGLAWWAVVVAWWVIGCLVVFAIGCLLGFWWVFFFFGFGGILVGGGQWLRGGHGGDCLVVEKVRER